MADARVALVTGGSSGIGYAISVLLAQEGLKVVIGDIDAAKGAAVVQEIKNAGGDAAFVQLDVVSEAEWDAAIEFVIATYGTLHVLVNNAGISGGRMVFHESSLEEYERIVKVTSTSVFLGCKAASKELLKNGTNASCVNICSMFSNVGGLGTNPGYHAAKGAVRTLTKNAAIAWAPQGVRVNSVHPGFIDTPMIRNNSTQERLVKLGELCPLGRTGTPEEVANVVAFLASNKASFMTGSEVTCDGGYTAQ